ncbi:MAG: hypothetical protein LBQ43_02860 [Holosporales bacterium]|jgi:hypothetical protein|nr:hypothetical protein [Holosporales bacterium]
MLSHIFKTLFCRVSYFSLAIVSCCGGNIVVASTPSAVNGGPGILSQSSSSDSSGVDLSLLDSSDVSFLSTIKEADSYFNKLKNGEENIERGVARCKELFQKGNLHCGYVLGRCCFEGVGREQDIQQGETILNFIIKKCKEKNVPFFIFVHNKGKFKKNAEMRAIANSILNECRRARLAYENQIIKNATTALERSIFNKSQSSSCKIEDLVNAVILGSKRARNSFDGIINGDKVDGYFNLSDEDKEKYIDKVNTLCCDSLRRAAAVSVARSFLGVSAKRLSNDLKSYLGRLVDFVDNSLDLSFLDDADVAILHYEMACLYSYLGISPFDFENALAHFDFVLGMGARYHLDAKYRRRSVYARLEHLKHNVNPMIPWGIVE